VPDIWSADFGDSSTLEIGQLAVAIGSPAGLAYPNSVSSGIISALRRSVDIPASTASGSTPTSLRGLIQTDAAMDPGSSGGPLCDADGRVIGIATEIGDTTPGVGFAIPIDVAKPIVAEALAGEPLARPYMGITYWLIDRGMAADYDLPLGDGAWIHDEDSSGNSIDPIASGSPAQKAGLRDGDIITAIEGQAIDQKHTLDDALLAFQPGDTVHLDVYRAGERLTIALTLAARPANP
jgi:S1-C subfamily serine protease